MEEMMIVYNVQSRGGYYWTQLIRDHFLDTGRIDPSVADTDVAERTTTRQNNRI